METVRAKISESGRLSIPSEFRKALGLEAGGNVIVKLEGNELRIYSAKEALRRAQQKSMRLAPAGTRGMSSDELIADRRRETRREIGKK